MKVWEWQDHGMPVWIGLGDPLDHWRRRHQVDTRLNLWLRQFDSCPEVDNTWLPSEGMKLHQARTLARARIRSVLEWAGSDTVPWLRNPHGYVWARPIIHVDRTGMVTEHESVDQASRKHGLARSTILDYAWRALHGWFYP